MATSTCDGWSDTWRNAGNRARSRLWFSIRRTIAPMSLLGLRRSKASLPAFRFFRSARAPQAVQMVRASDSRGRHTTTSRELFALPGGALLIDTPGLRELQLWDAAEGVEQAFSDIEELAAQCKYGNCGHTTEPGCAVQTA